MHLEAFQIRRMRYPDLHLKESVILKKKVLVQSLVVSATMGSVAAAPLQAHGEQVEQTATTQQKVQRSFDEVKYQALEQAAISAVEKAKQDLQAANDTLAKLEAAAKLEIAGAEKEVAAQQAALKAAEATVATAKETLKKEQEKLAEVQARHDDTVAMAEAEIATAEKRIKEKEEPYLAAKEAAAKAEAEVNDTVAAHQEEQTKQQAIIDQAQAKIDQAEADYQQSKTAFEQSEAAVQAAENTLAERINEINDQPNVINQANNEKAAAQHAVEDALIRSGEAQANHPVLEAAASQAKTAYETAEAAEASKLPMLNQEISNAEALIAVQEALLASMNSGDAGYAAEQSKLAGYQAMLQYSQDEKNTLAAETAQALTNYSTAKAQAEAALAEIAAAETAYQASVTQQEATNKAADEKIAAAEEMMANKEALITEAENNVQSANLDQEQKLAEMNKAEVNKATVAAEQQEVIEKAEAAIAKSLEAVEKAESVFQTANLLLEEKEKEYHAVRQEQQLVIDFSNETIRESEAKLKTQQEAVAEAQKALTDAEKAVKELEAAVASAKKNLEAVKADAKAKIDAAKAEVAKNEAALKMAEDRLAGLRAGANDARTGKLKANNAGMSISYQQGYEDAYALLSVTGSNVFISQQKNIYIKEYKKAVPATSGQLPQTGDAENLAAVLMGLGLITISGAALLKKKYAV
ncbi:hypothetical protein IGK47_001400 [Enterococcus sp. AZ007]